MVTFQLHYVWMYQYLPELYSRYDYNRQTSELEVISYDGSSKLYFNNVNGYNVKFSVVNKSKSNSTLTATIANTEIVLLIEY